MTSATDTTSIRFKDSILGHELARLVRYFHLMLLGFSGGVIGAEIATSTWHPLLGVPAILVALYEVARMTRAMVKGPPQ
jgi:hypothetical protein